MDHMAVIDFEGFRDLTTAVGGVDVYVPEEVYDSARTRPGPRAGTTSKETSR